MKNCFLIIVLMLSIGVAQAQDISGAYGYSRKPQGNPPKTEAGRGPSGNLVLIRMDGNKYRFWLDLTLGWPSYSVGETDGTVTFMNDTASFDNTFENAINACILKFKKKGSTISITSAAPSFNCGFGNGVTADDDYIRLKTQPVLNNEWLKKEYGQSPATVITSDKAEIFQDENCMHPFAPKKYFVKGDSILSIAEQDKSVYTEHIPSPGKFVYGWVRKTDLKMH
jgi:hypothetical protein